MYTKKDRTKKYLESIVSMGKFYLRVNLTLLVILGHFDTYYIYFNPPKMFKLFGECFKHLIINYTTLKQNIDFHCLPKMVTI